MRDGRTRRLLVIDDDELTRELLGLVAADAGFEAETFDSGDAALHALASETEGQRVGPNAVLCDMQMPGLTGGELARQLRAACGAETLLIAMSGSRNRGAAAEFDRFLLKPFSSEDLTRACERRRRKRDTSVGGADVLSERVYAELQRGMPAEKVADLYALLLDDARKRLVTMRTAIAGHDVTGYRRAAHAIKGGCGMAGALELAAIASELEAAGFNSAYNENACYQSLDRLLAAMGRLERVLIEKANQSEASLAGPQGH